VLTRMIIIVGGSLTVLVASSAPALAGGGWGGVDCGQNPNPGCELRAGRGADGGPGALVPRPRVVPPGGRRDGDDHVGAPDRPVQCSYVRSDYRPPTNGVAPVAYQPHVAEGALRVRPAALWRRTAGRVAIAASGDPASGQPGAWYVYKCDQSGVIDALYRAPVWIPDRQPGALPSPAQLAEQARSQLLLPSPRIEANPVGEQLVNLPTWLWLDSASWGPRSATVLVPGVSVTAVAKPTSVAWSMGDGTSVICRGQGTPFPPGGNPRAASPDCGHTYRISSADQSGQTFPVTATVHWSVIWWGADQRGTFPDLTTSANTHFRVAEAQALGTGTR
jgi:hypothetical protein